MLTRKLVARKKGGGGGKERKGSGIRRRDFRVAGQREKGVERKILLRVARGNDGCIAWRLREIMPVEYQRGNARCRSIDSQNLWYR